MAIALFANPALRAIRFWEGVIYMGKGRLCFAQATPTAFGEGRSSLVERYGFHPGCATAYTGVSYSTNVMTQSNDLSQRVDRNEGQIVDLQMTANLILQAIDKNSTDIAVLIEVSRRNSEAISVLQASQIRTDEAITSLNATIERMDRLFDYLIRRDQERSTE
jgi:uncharacterized protein YwgA